MNATGQCPDHIHTERKFLPRVCDGCSAPVCPAQDDNGELWFPPEQICRRHDFTRTRLVVTQRKIQRRAVHRDDIYSRAMLERVVVVRGGIRGRDPNRTREVASLEGRKAGPSSQSEVWL